MTSLSTQVVVTNRLYMPIGIISARKAICLLLEDRAFVLNPDWSTKNWEKWCEESSFSDDDENCIHTPNKKILIPAVMVLTEYDKSIYKEPKFSRHNLFVRDDFTCQYCGKKKSARWLSMDHIVPVSKGGKTTWENIVCACLPCNLKKGNKSLEEFGAVLPKKPSKPKQLSVLNSLVYDPKRFEPYKSLLDPESWESERTA